MRHSTASFTSPAENPSILLGAPNRLVRTIAPKLRLADLREIDRATGLAPLEALERSVTASAVTFHVLYRGRPGAIGGVVTSPADSRVGIPWMVGTDFITAKRIWFARNTAALWAIVEQPGYVVLANMVDVENAAHLRWLRWSGCHFGETQTINGHLFINFARRPTEHLDLPDV